MNHSFKATCIHAEDMGDYLLVGLADHPFDTVDYLTFQRAHEFDEQDVRLSMNAVHVERNDQSCSSYGGMRSVVLFPDRLHIDFDDRGIKFMNGLASTDVMFDLPRERFEVLRSALKQCFSGFDYFHDDTSNVRGEA